jgi:hypothetical protein
MFERLTLVFILLFAMACNSEPETDVSGLEAQPAVLLSDLVATERNDAVPPESPHIISLSQKEIELEGQRFIDLEGKKLAPRVGSDPSIPLLKQRLSTTPGKSGAVLRVHANASWGVLARILATLAELGVSPVMFEVRKDFSGTLGYLALGTFEIDAKDEGPQPFGGELQKDWNRVVASWEEMSGNCAGRGAVTCPSPSEPVLEGGLSEMELFAQQDALRIRFRRFFPGRYADEPDEPPKPPKVKAGEPEFMWRRAAARLDGSPIALTTRPLCGAERCGAVVRAPAMAAAGSIIRLIAATFPNGAPAPDLRIVIPPDA